ncbi:hypothetical protein BJV82DRAFT_131358 [Fennellomyces sp. T-0311]|nr:hypothetical protein BJV82DRAFT_131358 [Fennellomyces sp. T-0311]
MNRMAMRLLLGMSNKDWLSSNCFTSTSFEKPHGYGKYTIIGSASPSIIPILISCIPCVPSRCSSRLTFYTNVNPGLLRRQTQTGAAIQTGMQIMFRCLKSGLDGHQTRILGFHGATVGHRLAPDHALALKQSVRCICPRIFVHTRSTIICSTLTCASNRGAPSWASAPSIFVGVRPQDAYNTQSFNGIGM